MMFKDRVAYPGRLFVDTMGMIARCGTVLLLYAYIFKTKNNSINGLTYQTAAWSMYLYFLFMTLRIRYIATTIMENVKSGTVETLFVKPIHYLVYRSWWQLGQGLYSFLIVLIFGVTFLWATVGIPETMQSSFFMLSFLCVFILSSILSIFLYSIVGLLAFWIQDIKPLFWIIDKMVMILGGSFIPVALFPKSVYLFATLSPFGASQFITHTVYQTWSTTYIHMILTQVLWITVLGLVVSFMFKKAQKKVSVNGG